MSSDYSTNEHGIITQPGKFQGEMRYIPDFWSQGLDGCATEDIGTAYFFKVTDEDRSKYPELADVYGIAVEEDSQGFVHSAHYETASLYNVAVNQAEMEEGIEE